MEDRFNNSRRFSKAREKERIHKRYNPTIDPENYKYIPEKKQVGYYDEDVHQRVAIYVRVSTDDIRQTTSYELQKRYYEEFVDRHPNWTLVNIYADEGISGTSLKHRDAFNQMIEDSKQGKIDMIITKSVSRFARNVEDFIGAVRNLAELRPHVGVFFESEAIFSLNDDSQMALTFQATMGEEESHIRSRSMEASLRMRLHHGIPLTPKLYGYTHDEDGELIINPEEAPYVKLMFYMYLYGYSTKQIAEALNKIECRSYWGISWSAGSVNNVLRNERHCGDVLTRKTITENYRTHRKLKNRGERPQSWYFNHHEAIVSRDDFNAVQRMLDNAKYGNKSILPELRVIDRGMLKGFVTIHPRWAGFSPEDYLQAAQSVYTEESSPSPPETFEVEPGDFDFRGFEITRSEFLTSASLPGVYCTVRRLMFNATCVHKFEGRPRVELLINPLTKELAIRQTSETDRSGVLIAKSVDGRMRPREISCTAFVPTLFKLMGWKESEKYHLTGRLLEQEGAFAFVFDANDPEVAVSAKDFADTSAEGDSTMGSPITTKGGTIRAFPQRWASSFGTPFYQHELTWEALEKQTEDGWKIHVAGQLVYPGAKLKVTGFDDLRLYISEQLAGVNFQEVNSNNGD